MDIAQESLRLHEQWQGKLETVPKMRIETREDLALAYTPGVAERAARSPRILPMRTSTP